MTRWAAPMLLATLLTAGACASPSDSGGSQDAAPRSGAVATEEAADASMSKNGSGSDSGSKQEGPEQAIINTGTITLRSGDVAKTRLDAQKVIDAHKGQVADEETAADSDGEMSTTRLVLRVPAGDFDTVMTQLGDIAELAESSRSSEDVTTQVIDNNVRVRAQEKSLKRVEVLLAEAKTVSEIISIESQLTTRQSELDSLKRRQAYLKDQTSLSTVNLYIEHDYAASAPEKDEDHNAFVAGLLGGWDALKGIGGGLAQVFGALLPFALVIGLVGAPLAALLRRMRGRGKQPAAPEPA